METTPQLREALATIQIEYVHMPQLKLTARQVQRLWSLSNEACEAVLAALIGGGFLTRAPDGAYVRCRSSRAGLERLMRPPLSQAS